MNTRSMTLTIERTPLTVEMDGKSLQVEVLGIRLPFARKPADLGDKCPTGNDQIYITETRLMSPEEFDAFAMNFMKSRDWLSGKGGYVGEARLCVEIHAPGRPYLYVDPSGSDYARHVGRLG